MFLAEILVKSAKSAGSREGVGRDLLCESFFIFRVDGFGGCGSLHLPLENERIRVPRVIESGGWFGQALASFGPAEADRMCSFDNLALGGLPSQFWRF